MSSFKGWLEHRVGAMTGMVKARMDGPPIAEVDAELADLVPLYLKNLWTDLGLARQLLRKRDFHLLSRMARRIQGNAASYGFGGLGAIAQGLEEAAGRSDPAAATLQLDSFERFLSSVRIVYL